MQAVRKHKVVSVPEELLVAYGEKIVGKKISDIQFVDSGLSNSNYKFEAGNENFLLRLFGTNTLGFEKEVRSNELTIDLPFSHKLLSSAANLPDFQGPVQIYTWDSGLTLNDFFLHTNDQEHELCGGKVGAALAQIKTITGEQSELDHFSYCKLALEAENLKSHISEKMIDSANRLLDKHKIEISSFSDEAMFCHGDFSSKNIIVREIHGTWEVAAIVDWEDSFFGSQHYDIANHLRHSEDFPAGYIDGFTKGYRLAGGELSPGWQKKNALADLPSILSCLNSKEDRPVITHRAKKSLRKILKAYG
jgi:Ser/Thr protein kinase RdoA (MazF antagonist)